MNKLKDESIKIGMGWWGFRELPFQTHLEISKHFGFKILEIGIGDELISTFPVGLDDNKITESKSLAGQFGIRLPFATVENDFTLTHKEDHLKMLDYVFKAIHTASLFNVTHIRIFAGFLPAKEITNRIYSQVVDAFRMCESLCKDYNILISIETHGRITYKGDIAFHENTISTDPNFLEKLMKDLPPSVGFNYDPGNIKAVRPSDKTYCLDIINERINYCHLKDWKNKNGGWEAVAIGDDNLDYSPILERIKYNGVFLIEYEPVKDLKEGITRSLEYLKRIGYDYSFN